jgi:hypothetical protein
MAHEIVELLLEARIGTAISQLSTQTRPREPACTASVGHDVRDRFAVHGKCHSLACLHGINDTSCVIAQIPDTDVHVRQCSTWLEHCSSVITPST